MSKRWKYCIDYLVDNDLADLTFIGTIKNERFNNPESGIYREKVVFHNSNLRKSLKSIVKSSRIVVKLIRNNYRKNQKNIVVFSTLLDLEQIPAIIYARKLGYKVVSDQVENYDVSGGDISKYLLIINRIFPLFYKKVDGFLCISSLLVEKFRKKTNAKILLLPNSAPIGVITPKKSFSKPFSILYTGTMASKDGLGYLVRGFIDFVSRIQANAELILVGSGEIPEDIRKEVNSCDKIKCLGFVTEEELQNLFASKDLMAMTRCNSPFANYGFPFKLSEYLSTGHPVLATNVGDVGIYVEDKKSAFVVRPENSEDISEALEYIYTHEDEAIRIGYNGLEVAKKSFNKNLNGETLYNFLQNL